MIQALDLLRGVLRDRVLRQARLVKNRKAEKDSPVHEAAESPQG